MDHTREELEQLSADYISETLSCMDTVLEFCGRHSKWVLQRERELEKMRDISDRAKKINLTSEHFQKSDQKVKAFGEFLWSKVTQVTAERRAQELEKKLGCLLQDTLKGLQELTLFLEAVEKLAVTSLSVFGEDNLQCPLPEGTSAHAIRSAIISARGVCPLLIHFQRDAEDFFMPSLINVDLLAFQLDKYIRVSLELCETLQKREELEQLSDNYISDTLSCMDTVLEFCGRHSKWVLQRETELEMMRDISDRAEKINLTSEHFRKSDQKVKAFGQFLWSKITQVTAERRAQELEKELGCLLQDTLKGLQELTLFLEAVEKLAFTLLSVFEEDNLQCSLPEGTSAHAIRSAIMAARGACPLLIHFQRDAEDFFMPSLINVDLLAFQLDKYIRVSQELCEKLQKRTKKACMGEPCSNLTNEAIQNMFDLLSLLTNIRLDRHFRMTYLFRGAALRFVGLFSQRCSRMRQFLEALEEAAVQLDRMKLGASISSVAGSSVSFAGGVVSIVGLALAPVTAGASLTLTMVGAGLGITCGVNSLATGITEQSVNTYQGKKVNKIYKSHMEDVESILECLEQAASSSVLNSVTSSGIPISGPNVLACILTPPKTAHTVRKQICEIKKCASARKVLRAEMVAKVVSQEVKAARNVPNVAADLTDFGQLAKGTPLALSKSVRAGFITLNSIFMGLDLFFICKDSISLTKGSKSDVSKLIRGRASLWKTELDAWERIHHSLCIGIWRFRKGMEALQWPFNS